MKKQKINIIKFLKENKPEITIHWMPVNYLVCFSKAQQKKWKKQRDEVSKQINPMIFIKVKEFYEAIRDWKPLTKRQIKMLRGGKVADNKAKQRTEQ